MFKRVTSRAAVLTSGVLALALLAACGSSDNSGSTTPAPGTTASESAASDPTASVTDTPPASESATGSSTEAATGSASSAPSTSSGQSAFPVTVPTLFGDVVVDKEPLRVVALGWSDAETALALGVQPVGASDWLAFGGEGVGPWAEGLYTSAPEILGTTEISFEAVAALKPDLILNTRSDNSEQTYKTLSAIAPTISAPVGMKVLYGTTWKQQMELVSTALGKAEEGRAKIAEVDAAFAASAAANPEFAGKTVALGAYFGTEYGAYVTGDSRVDFLTSLGFVQKPELDALASGSFYVPISGEELDKFDADLTVIFPIGDVAQTLKDDKKLQSIPSAKAGHLLILEDTTLINAFSSGSTLGSLYAIDKAVPLFAKTLNG
ncbi:iron-siderophore ABC transporter substrate-binding protein [Nakamurella silvestris]|nr:iron-siderophore ABC transporter substrate-binding protein [Nakamurella silvestris]